MRKLSAVIILGLLVCAAWVSESVRRAADQQQAADPTESCCVHSIGGVQQRKCKEHNF